MKLKGHKIISALVFGLLFAGMVQVSNILYYHFASFDHFVKIEKFELVGMNGDQIFVKLINRTVRIDVQAHSVKELHRIEEDGLYQIPRMCDAPCEDYFVFEKENNGTDNRYEMNWGVPVTEPGEYQIIEHFTLHLPYGAEKSKSITSTTYTLE